MSGEQILKQILLSKSELESARRLHKAHGDSENKIRPALAVFGNLVEILKNKQETPNQEINQLITLFWQLIVSEDIAIATNIQREKTLDLVLNNRNGVIIPLLNIPYNYNEEVRENIYLQLGRIVKTASLVRDYYVFKLNSAPIPPESIVRAEAFEAEYLHMLIGNDNSLALTDYQQDLVQSFPEGLNSIQPHMRYPTPEYKVPDSKNN
jgi:hypothetical protein